MAIEIKSSLINNKDFRFLKESLIAASEKDGEDKFRVKTIEYINDSSGDNEDIFFYDMLEFTRFLKPGTDSIAFTTPNHLIYLNCPNETVGKNVRQWEFVYDHECLHQLWDTFGVEAKIKEEYGSCHHYLLNIASDCVINDYLYFYRKKDRPNDLITPEYIKETYGIDYDRRNDTQFTLYLKIKKIEDENYELFKKLLGDKLLRKFAGGEETDEEPKGKPLGGGGQGKSPSNEKPDEKSDEKPDEKPDDKDKPKQNGGGAGDDGNNPPSAGNGEGIDDQHPEDLEKLKHKAEEVIEKYKNKISGAFGEFISKCRSSLTLKESGLGIGGARNGGTGWNQKMNSYINSFVKKKVFQKKRQYEATFKRPKRRSGFVKEGDPLQKGRRLKKESLTINVAFYIDRSGSMSNSITDVFKAAYTICDSLKKQFGKEKVVDEVTFKMYAFDDTMHELKFGNTISADGGTMNFDRILGFISKNTKEFLVNIIITDAGFSIDTNEVAKFIKDIDGMLLFITNIDSNPMKNLAKKYDTQLFYVLADHNFTLK